MASPVISTPLIAAVVVEWLAAQRSESSSLTADALDSLDVAIQCICESLGCGEPERRQARTLPSLPSLLSSSPAVTAALSTPSTPSTATAPLHSSSDPIATSPLFLAFLSTLSSKGYFSGCDVGSDEYAARRERALASFKSKAAAAASSSSSSSSSTAAAAASSAAVDEVEVQAEGAKEAGNAAIKSGRFSDAIAHYTRAIDAVGSSGRNVHIYYSNRAAARMGVKDWKGAIEDGRAAVSADSNYAKAFVRLGSALQMGERYEEAVTAFSRGLELDSTSDVARSGLAACKAKLRPVSSGSAAPPPAAGGSMPAGLAGLMGNPMLASMMSNPAVMAGVQQMMSNPDAMSNIMRMMGSGGMPDLSSLAGAFPSSSGPSVEEVGEEEGEAAPAGLPPALAGMASDPEVVAMQSDPEMRAIMEEIQRDGMGAMSRHAGNPKVQRLMNKMMGSLGGR